MSGPDQPIPTRPGAGHADLEPSVLDFLRQQIRDLPRRLLGALRRAGSRPAPTPPTVDTAIPIDTVPAPTALAPRLKRTARQARPSPAAMPETVSAKEQFKTKLLRSEVVDGTLKLRISAELPASETLHITVNKAGMTASVHEPAPSSIEKRQPENGGGISVVSFWHGAAGWLVLVGRKLFTSSRLRGNAPLLLSAIVYALVIGIGIDRYPIYFFTDEAVHMNLAADFIRDGFTNYYHEFMPTFFTFGGWMNGTSVYLQVIPFLLFGKSILVTRLVSAFVTLLGALSISLLLKDVFKLKRYWVAVLVLASTPAWFLHARTAFEYVLVGSFYSIFLWLYGRYRSGQDGALKWAVVAGALTFYSHGLAEVLMGVTALALFIVDLPYHFQPARRRAFLFALGLAVVLFLPFVRYYLAHPGESYDQMVRRGSYLVDAGLSTSAKIAEFFRQWLRGITLVFWYTPDHDALMRHLVNGRTYGALFTLPFVLYGIGKSLYTIRHASSRLAVLAFLVAPIPSALRKIEMPRVVWLAMPLAIFAAIGISDLVFWLEQRVRVRPAALSAFLMLALGVPAFSLLNDALANGPTYYTDYGLYGMQYGARQVYGDLVEPALVQDPSRYYIVSPDWANGTEQFVSFFVRPDLQGHVKLGPPIKYIDLLRQDANNLYFVLMPSEYQDLRQDAHFQNIRLVQTVPYPTGAPGFYVVQMQPADNIDQLLEMDHIRNITPIEATLPINGVSYRVRYSPISAGEPAFMFDGNTATLVRGTEANPFIIDLYPETPIRATSLSLFRRGMLDFTVTVLLYAPGETQPVAYRQDFRNLPMEQEVVIGFPGAPAGIAHAYIEIMDNRSGPTAQIHVLDLAFH